MSAPELDVPRVVKLLEEFRGDLGDMLEVRPPMRTPYLKGMHGVAVVREGLPALDAAIELLRALPQLSEDAARLGRLESRGVRSIYFADGSQFSLGFLSLRAALDILPAVDAAHARSRLSGDGSTDNEVSNG